MNITAGPIRRPILTLMICLIVLTVGFLTIAGMVERSRSRKRLETRRAAAMKTTEAEPEPEPQKRTGTTDDLFGVPSTGPAMPGRAPSSGTAGTSPFDFGTSSSPGFDDLFGTSKPAPVEEPFPAIPGSEPLQTDIDIFASTFEEAPSLDFTAEEEVIPPPTADPFKDMGRTEPKKGHDWSTDEKVDLSEHDLFDPL